MAKKQLGSITRTAIAFGSGIALSRAFDSGISIETLEVVASGLDYIGAVAAIVSVQIWSFIDKHKHDKLERKVNDYENLNN